MKIKQKIITIFMIAVLLGGVFLPTGQLAIAAAVENLEEQTQKTQSENVEFNTYLEGGTHQQEYTISEGGKLYLELNIKESGYFQNGIVEFSDCNYNINSNEINAEYVQKIENNCIYLKQLNSEQTLHLEIPISFPKEEQIDENIFNKNSTAKLKGTYINGKGQQISIEKEITNKIQWKTEEPEKQISAEITKCIPYNTNEKHGVLVQAKLTSSIKNNILPIKSTALEITVPTINDQKPSEVTVVANKTSATNGEETGLKFTSENYEYNEELSKVTINVNNNANEQGKIAWKNGQDEYLINFIYENEETYNYVTNLLETAKVQNEPRNNNAINMDLQVNGTITTYGTEEKQILLEETFNNNIQEEKGNLVDFTAETITDLSKGYIYANYAKTEQELAQKNEEASYEITYNAQINAPSLKNEIIFKTIEEKLKNEAEEIGVGTNIITKQIKIGEENFNNILGESGEIKVLDKSQKELGTINKDTPKDDQGNLVLNIEEENSNEVIIKVLNPVSAGNLQIKVEKSFIPKQSFEKDQMETFKKVLVSAGFEAKSSETEENKETKTQNMEINLTEPVSKAEIGIEEEKQTLSTSVVNENVKITAVLDTSSVQNALYENPSLEIKMPKQVTNVKLKDVDILLGDEFEVKSKNVTKDGDNQVIIIKLEGTQSKYENYTSKAENNVIAKGANIIVTADITLDPLATSKTEKVYMYYTNNNTDLYQNQSPENEYGIAETDVNISAPTGLITSNGVSGYDKQDSKSTNIDQELLNVTIQPKAQEKTVKFEGTVTNNYDQTIKNVYILGRFPFTGNKNPETSQDFGSNFTMPIKKGIKVSGVDTSNVKIYYSTDGEATKETVETEGSTWQESPSSYSDVKSYLIKITGEIQSKAEISFSYEAELPANLGYSKSTYTAYKVYYEEQIAQTKTSGIIGLTTGEAPNVDVKLSSEVPEGGNAKQGQMIKFTAEIKNTGGEDLNNVELNIPIPQNAYYVEYNIKDSFLYTQSNTTIKIPIGEVKPNETKTQTYTLMMQLDGMGEMSHTVNVVASNLQNEVSSNEYKLNIVEGKLLLELTSKRDYTLPVYKGNIIRAIINITPLQNINNATIKVDIPKGIKINSAIYYDENNKKQDYIKTENNQIIANVKGLQELTTQQISIELEVEDFEGDFHFVAKAEVAGVEESTSNELVFHGSMPKFEIIQTSSTKTVKEKENIVYEFNVRNVGDVEVLAVSFEDVLPQGLSFEKLEYTYQNETREITNSTNNTAKIYWSIFEKDATAVIKVTANANILAEGATEKEVTNTGSISVNNYEPKISNTVTTIIERNPKLYGEEPGKDSEITDDRAKYTISGVAWLDENKNGQREEAEQLLPEIEVVLLKKQNGEIAKNIENGKEKTTLTNENGEYKFENLKGGEYIVVFCYDSSQYNVTSYQAQNVNTLYNSDAVSMLITLNGKQTYAGVTNTIKITNKDIQNIDIGLYVSQKFDLKLDKYITKITVNTPSTGVKTYNVRNSQLEKVEIKSRDVGKSNIIIEYTIVVKNEGRLEGYVKKIVDYLPKNVRFNSELNKDWYSVDDNNTVYNSSLQDTLIKPGESKSVKLVLSAQIKSNNIGTIINNNAEICESYNEYGEHDIDSVEANMVENEDDISKADIILSTATGTIIIYATLALAVILIILIGVMLIKRKFDKI